MFIKNSVEEEFIWCLIIFCSQMLLKNPSVFMKSATFNSALLLCCQSFFLCSSLKSHFRLNTLHIKLWLIFLSPDANTIRDTEHLLKIAHRIFHLLAFFSSLDRSQTIRAFMPLVERELLNSFHRLIRTKGSALHRARGFRLLKGCGSLSSLQAARERTEYIGLHHC